MRRGSCFINCGFALREQRRFSHGIFATVGIIIVHSILSVIAPKRKLSFSERSCSCESRCNATKQQAFSDKSWGQVGIKMSSGNIISLNAGAK